MSNDRKDLLELAPERDCDASYDAVVIIKKNFFLFLSSFHFERFHWHKYAMLHRNRACWHFFSRME